MGVRGLGGAAADALDDDADVQTRGKGDGVDYVLIASWLRHDGQLHPRRA